MTPARIAELRALCAESFDGPHAFADSKALTGLAQALPEALDEVERLRAEVARLHEKVEDLKSDIENLAEMSP